MAKYPGLLLLLIVSMLLTAVTLIEVHDNHRSVSPGERVEKNHF